MEGITHTPEISGIELLRPGGERLARLAGLYSSDYENLVRFAYLVGGDRTHAEDLVQEAFVRVWRAGSRVDADRAPAYARRVIVNLTRSRFRRLLVERRALPGLAGREETEQPDTATRDEVWSAIRTLSPRERACVVLRYYEDFSEQQTAEALGIGVGSVKKMMSRAMEKLRATLGERSEP